MALHLAEISQAVEPGAHAVLLLDPAGWHLAAELAIPDNRPEGSGFRRWPVKGSAAPAAYKSALNFFSGLDLNQTHSVDRPIS